jgi:hypothetical protein
VNGQNGALRIKVKFRPFTGHFTPVVTSESLGMESNVSKEFESEPSGGSFNEIPDMDKLGKLILKTGTKSPEEVAYENVTSENIFEAIRYWGSKEITSQFAQQGHYFGYSKDEVVPALEKAYAKKVVELNHALAGLIGDGTGKQPAGEGIPAYSGTFIYSLLLSSVAYLGGAGIGDIQTASVTAMNDLYYSRSHVETVDKRKYSQEMLTGMKTFLQSKNQSGYIKRYANQLASAKPENVDSLMNSYVGQIVKRTSSRSILGGVGEMTTDALKSEFNSIYKEYSNSFNEKGTSFTPDNVSIENARVRKEASALFQKMSLEDMLRVKYLELGRATSKSSVKVSPADVHSSRNLNARRKIEQVKRLLRGGNVDRLIDKKGWAYRVAATSSAHNKVPQALMGYQSSGTLPLFTIPSMGWDKEAQHWGIEWKCTILAGPNYWQKIERGYQGWAGGYKPVEMMSKYVRSSEFLYNFRWFLYPRGSL